MDKGDMSEVLAFGAQRKESLVIIDDALGRRIAKLHGLRVTGTAGVLLKAKNSGVIPLVRPILARMKEVGFYLSEEVFHTVLRIAGEE